MLVVVAAALVFHQSFLAVMPVQVAVVVEMTIIH
jgi:hypothetical protein